MKIQDAIILWNTTFPDLVKKIDEIDWDEWWNVSIEQVKSLLTDEDYQKLSEYVDINSPNIYNAYLLRKEWQSKCAIE